MPQPNIVLILNDDMGFSDLGCFGGEVQTPNLDRLARQGLRYSQFYNTARCSPSRASLLTGLHPHQTGIGILTDDTAPEGYAGNLSQNCATIPEVLKSAGYRSYMSGKWHVATNFREPTDTWPMQRGFDDFFGTICGAGSFYHPQTLTRRNETVDELARNDPSFFYTDAISDRAAGFVREHQADHAESPFFLYVAYTAPHWPLHAHEEDIARYKGRFDAGWDTLREQRLERLGEQKLVDPSWKLSGRDPSQPPFEDADEKAWRLRCMEVYAAQIDRMDQGIGRILDALEQTGQLDDTIILFLADNGGCAEEISGALTPTRFVDDLMLGQYQTRAGETVHFGNDPSVMPGGEDSYQSYGVAWANLSNTPFRMYKHWVHEGGIATPLIVHWPGGISEAGAVRHTPGQLPDIMATLVDIAGATYPTARAGNSVPPLEGSSLLPSFHDNVSRTRPMYWEHEGNAAIRDGKWKLVRKYPGPWELYDMDVDRTELNDLSDLEPDRVAAMARDYEAWAERCGVFPRDHILRIMAEKERQRA